MKFFGKFIIGVAALTMTAVGYAASLVRPEVTIIAPDVWHAGQTVVAVVDVQANDFGHTKFNYYWKDFNKIAPMVKAVYRNKGGVWENITGYMINNDGVVHPEFWCIDSLHTVRIDLVKSDKLPSKVEFEMIMLISPGKGVNGYKPYTVTKTVTIINE